MVKGEAVLITTVHVTKTPHYLEQIAQVTIHRVQQVDNGLVVYAYYVDGHQYGFVHHRPRHGWAELIRLVMAALPESVGKEVVGDGATGDA